MPFLVLEFPIDSNFRIFQLSVGNDSQSKTAAVSVDMTAPEHEISDFSIDPTEPSKGNLCAIQSGCDHPKAARGLLRNSLASKASAQELGDAAPPTSPPPVGRSVSKIGGGGPVVQIRTKQDGHNSGRTYYMRICCAENHTRVSQELLDAAARARRRAVAQSRLQKLQGAMKRLHESSVYQIAIATLILTVSTSPPQSRSSRRACTSTRCCTSHP
jgi:hypothetical protein